MIISHKHKYVFVELPQTASSAIAKELKANYDGHEILFKHALYSTDFLKQAKPEEKAYKVISGMRNPMDICVSNYFKFKTDHENRYSNPRLMQHGFLRKYIMRWWNVRQYKSIVEKGETFEQFFTRAYSVPYASWSIIEHKRIFRPIKRSEFYAEDIHRWVQTPAVQVTRHFVPECFAHSRNRVKCKITCLDDGG